MRLSPPIIILLLLLLPLLPLAPIILLHPNDYRQQILTLSIAYRSTVSSSSASPTTTTTSHYFIDPVTPKPSFRLLLGILTRADHYERRRLLRLVYSLQTPPPSAVIDIKFIFCNLTKYEQTVLVALEIMRYDDIIILDCPENMNDGKTYTYFASLPSLLANSTPSGEKPYDYVMKADDDIYFRLPALAASLADKPREDMYWGFVIPCDSMDPFRDYMSGMGYVLSWDLVEWIASSEWVRNRTVGPEDLVTGSWLRGAGKGKHRHNTKPAMYNFPDPAPQDACSHELVPDTIGVHHLKDHRWWARTLKYFNVTDGLRPSKLYHIPDIPY